MIEIGLIISAFFAGILMFLAPCTLPIVPGYLGFISGVSLKDLEQATGSERRRIQRKIFLNGVLFVLGFTLVFITFGVLAGILGQAIAPYRLWMGRIGGVLIILFGLFMLGVFNFKFFTQEKRVRLPKFLKVGNPSTSFAIGSAFAVGWTPCVGPILASILLLAATSTTAVQGGVLLFIFSLGLAIPFLLVAAGTSYASSFIQKGNKYIKYISYVGGVFLIILGALLVTDNFVLTIQYGYKLFDFIGYDRLLEFL